MFDYFLSKSASLCICGCIDIYVWVCAAVKSRVIEYCSCLTIKSFVNNIYDILFPKAMVACTHGNPST